MESTIKPTLENLKVYYEKYDWDTVYPMHCVEKYYNKDKDIFYLIKGSKKALVFKDDSILLATAQKVKSENSEEENVYGIDKLYFRDIKKVNLKEFGTYGKVLGGSLQLTISFDGYEDIILDSFKDSGKVLNGQEMLECDFRDIVSDIFNKLNK